MSSERIIHTYTAEFWRNPYPWLFVVVEGLDGSGNSTQVDRLKDYYLEEGSLGDDFLRVEKEPTYGPAGAPVNYALRRGLKIDFQTLQLMFTADRSDHLHGGGILDHLQQTGNIVLTDRYFLSTPAYGYASGLDIDWLIAAQSKFIMPDFTFFLDVPPEVCLERIKKRNRKVDLFEKLEYLTKARDGYYLLMQKLPGVIIPIDGQQGISPITEQLVDIIEKSPKRQR